MNSKEYAADILYPNLTHDQKAERALNAVGVCVNEAWTAARSVRPGPSQASKMREGLSKWKAIVRLCKEADPDHPIEVCYFGLYLALAQPELYESLVNQRVFLGYEFTPKEERILSELKSERESKVAKSFAIDPIIAAMILSRWRGK